MMHVRGRLVAAALLGPLLTASEGKLPVATMVGACAQPYRVSFDEMLQAMATHGAYDLTATTTSMRFGTEALLKLVHRRLRESPGSTRLFIDQVDWFTAHRQTAGVTYDRMSEAARSGFEHHQDVTVDYGQGVVKEVLEGPAPVLALDVTIAWPDSGNAPSSFTYKDTLSVPRVEVHDSRVIRFKLVEYPDMLLYDEIDGIAVKPLGFLSAVFALVGKPDLKQNRVAVSPDQWQVMRARVKILPGISKTGTAAIDPDGRGHEKIPDGRNDLHLLDRRLEQPLKLTYGKPACQS
jgi:hypothetical protein